MNTPARRLGLFLQTSLLAISWVGMNHVSADEPQPPLLPISGVSAPAGPLFGDSIVDNADLEEGPGSVPGAPASVELGDSNSLATFTTPPGNDYWPAGTTITFSLGNTYNITDLLIWNNTQNDFQDFGAYSIAISSSMTGTVGSFSTPRLETLTEAPFGGTDNGTYNVPAQVIAYDTIAKYIDVTLISSYASAERIATYGDVIGLNEVNFVGVVPERSTYAMVLGALALLGFCVRRKAVPRGSRDSA